MDIDDLCRTYAAGNTEPWHDLWDDPRHLDPATMQEAPIIESAGGESVVGAIWYDGPWVMCKREDVQSIIAIHNAFPLIAEVVRAAIGVVECGGNDTRSAFENEATALRRLSDSVNKMRGHGNAGKDDHGG